MSGRCRRTTSAIARRSSTPYSRIAVGKPEELDLVDADRARRRDLLGLAQGTALVGVDPVDPGLAARHHAVDDALALPGPARHCRGAAVLDVVGVGDHEQRGLPVLGKGLERGRQSPCVRAWHSTGLCSEMGDLLVYGLGHDVHRSHPSWFPHRRRPRRWRRPGAASVWRATARPRPGSVRSSSRRRRPTSPTSAPTPRCCGARSTRGPTSRPSPGSSSATTRARRRSAGRPTRCACSATGWRRHARRTTPSP